MPASQTTILSYGMGVESHNMSYVESRRQGPAHRTKSAPQPSRPIRYGDVAGSPQGDRRCPHIERRQSHADAAVPNAVP
jgi:hypothetical protein